MPTDKYITLGPEHIAPSIIAAFGERWFVGRLNGRSTCGFVRDDIGKRLYLVDGHLRLSRKKPQLECPHF